MVQMIPRDVNATDVILTWLVDKDADSEIDAEKIAWMWDVTTVQDKKIVEDNADGIASRAYRPGPYTPLESQTAFFVATYLSEMRTLLTGESSGTKRQWSAPAQLSPHPRRPAPPRLYPRRAPEFRMCAEWPIRAEHDPARDNEWRSGGPDLGYRGSLSSLGP